MTSRDFCFWLQGWFEIDQPKSASGEVLNTIQNHLNLVFKHEIDPSYSDDPKVQEELTKVHNGIGKKIFPSQGDILLRC